MGAVFMMGDEVLAWGFARTLLQPTGVQELGRDAKAAGVKHKVKTDVHAEQDAIAYAARYGVPLEGATAFVTGAPCTTCLPLMVATGVKEIVFVGLMERSYPVATCSRLRQVAADNHVTLREGMPMPPFLTESSRLPRRKDLELQQQVGGLL